MKTIVITGAGTATCQGVIKALRLQNEIPVKLIVTDPDLYTAGRYLADGFEEVPLAADPGFVDRLIEITRKHQADVLIPIVDMEFLPIARRAKDFDCVVALSDEETISQCTEKDKTYQAMDALGIRHPRVISVGPDTTASVGTDGDFPMFVKPRIGRASLDCYRAENREELKHILPKVDDPLVTEFIDGVEMTIDTFSTLDREWVGGRVRVREMTKAGVSTKGLIIHNGTVLSQARTIVEGLGIRGFGCLQCFNTADGPVWFEVNPRFGGASILSVASGLNSPLMLLKSIMGLPLDKDKPTGVARMMRFWQEVFIDGRGQEIGRSRDLVRSAD
jgi:carbamoyl-phosphate synthase large subunit